MKPTSQQPDGRPALAAGTLSDAEMAQLERFLDAVPAPLEPLDVSMLDGYLAAVALQPQPVAETRWLAHVFDVDGRRPPAGFDTGAATALIRRRFAELDHAIGTRQWFDPWIYELDAADAAPLQATLPWVAGFATAMACFPALMALDDPGLLEPLALLYRAVEPEDLEDADALIALIETLEPPADLAEAVEDVVRAVLLLADVTRPVPAARRG